ncbi:nucleotidyltransferase domain-containing protein [Thauera sp. SDU_THAU2]|uniref:nucleotidyltransferase domain-containing protein n=1 Tax=Thauera sp. SDU_THAU2 TaxID=3136633 RepID=UPI00311E8552
MLREPASAHAMGLGDWEGVIRLARAARLHATLGCRLMVNPALWAAVPEQPRGHLQAAMNFAAHRRHLLELELRTLADVLPPGIDVVLLKGAAYQMQGLPSADGRIAADIDLLVRRADLDAVEAALAAEGWASTVSDEYDQRYYREWSHELPPMRAEGHALELDLHHAIAPVTSRCTPDVEMLFAALLPLPGLRFSVLSPADQLVHAVVHLFQDTELDGRLRDLVDIDGLLRMLPADDGSMRALAARVRQHGADRLFWYALHYCERWLGTSVPAVLWPSPPPRPVRRVMDWMVAHTLLPRLPEARSPLGWRAAGGLARLRYHRMRMPVSLLARHAAIKTWRNVRQLARSQ